MDLTFRKSAISELDEIMALFRSAIANMDKNGIYQWDEIYPAREDLAADIAGECLTVGLIDGRIAVVFAINHDCDEQYANGKWQYPDSRFCVIHRLCVHPSFQNRGVARKALEYIEITQRSLGIESIRLDAFTENPYSLKLYARLGYSTVGYANWRKGKFCLMEKSLINLPDTNFNFHNENDVIYITSPLLDNLPWLTHGMSTRIGGVSEDCCASMNLSFNKYDSKENVTENYRRFCRATGIDSARIVTTAQVHGDNVRIVTSDHECNYVSSGVRDFEDSDGMITNVPGITLMCFGADCPVIMFADPVNKAVGICHSGWRGTVAKIAANVVNLMRENYGTKPENVLAVISPSICQDCYEVGEEVIENVKGAYPQKIRDEIFYVNQNGKYQLSLWNANRQTLLETGVRPENIFLPDLCTKCSSNLFFSHRVMGEKRGLNAAFVMIKE